jgi:hypothetical protein
MSLATLIKNGGGEKKRLSKSLLMSFSLVTATAIIGVATSSQASTFTRTSPTSSGLLPTAVSEVGGIVVDIIGVNGTRIVTQTAASSLFVGFAGTNPQDIGTQTGFTTATVNSLGGGIAQAAVRVTLFDGDTAAGNFDFNQNELLLNGIIFGNFSDVQTQETDGLGNPLSGGFSGGGFRNNLLDTGFFFSNDATLLGDLFTSLSTGSIVFSVDDASPFDNFYDFTQGVDSSLIDIEVPPIVTPPVSTPEPSSIGGLGILGGGLLLKRRRK